MNKRTAAIAMLAFLDLNGYEFRQTDEEVETMIPGLGDPEVPTERVLVVVHCW